MAAVTSIYYMRGWGSSFSGTLNLPRRMSSAVAQLAVTSAVFINGYSCDVWLTGYSANGEPVSVIGSGAVTLAVSNVDSFSFAGETSPEGGMIASITAYCFE